MTSLLGCDEILHVTTRTECEAALVTGTYAQSTRGKSFAEVGFIHCSTPEQLPVVAAHVYRGCPDELAVLELSRAALEAAGVPVRFEDGGDGVDYPHLYAPLPCHVVGSVRRARIDASGGLQIAPPGTSR